MKGFILARAAVTAYRQKAVHKQITEKQKVPAGKSVKVSHSSAEKNVSSTAPLPVLELRVPSNPKSVPKRKLGYKVLEIYSALTMCEYVGYHLTEDQKNELLKWYRALRSVYMERFCTNSDTDKVLSVLNLLVDECGNIVEDKVKPTATNARVCSANASEIRGKADTESASAKGYSKDVVGDKLDQVDKERVCASVVNSIDRGGGNRSY